MVLPSSDCILQLSMVMSSQQIQLLVTPARWKTSFQTSPLFIMLMVLQCVTILHHPLDPGGFSATIWSTTCQHLDDTVCCCSFNDIIFDALRLIECNKVKWWSDELSKNEYDGVIGLSQGSAMTALLLSMVSTTLFLRYPAIPLWFGKQNCSPEF